MRTLRSTLLAAGAALVTAAAGLVTPVAASAAPVVQPTIAQFSAPTPDFAANLAPGGYITARPGTWTPQPTSFHYSFYRVKVDGSTVLLQSSTSPTYRITAADLNNRIRVAVAGSRSGYQTAVRYSRISGHVLYPSQRSIMPSTGGDFNDIYVRGTGSPTQPEATVAVPGKMWAYLVMSCTNPSGEWYRMQVTDAAGKSDIYALGQGSYGGSAVFSAYYYDNPAGLVKVNVRCAGPWTLNVRPAATAPVTTNAVLSGTGSKAYIYTGPRASRVFTRQGGELAWFDAFGPSGTMNVEFATAAGVTAKAAYLPAGPVFLQVTTSGTWKIA